MTNNIVYNGRELPAYQAPAYGYTSTIVHRGVAYVSGHVPKTGAYDLNPGKVGRDVSLEEAQAAAQLAVMNALSTLNEAIGGLENVEQFLKITVFVASAADFNQQPKVADAATNLLHDIFGKRGSHARSAVGVAELPRNSCVEIELTVAVKEGA
ncbi:RidA family protein [Rhizobium sp.]|jgi:enamine deaminase RidA (YjgF/YER057c/UK114 family)|uniref:RidA family protein n=1 Tax=Rhizobium sp. TaxID=391 RepID=UPI0028AB93F7